MVQNQKSIYRVYIDRCAGFQVVRHLGRKKLMKYNNGSESQSEARRKSQAHGSRSHSTSTIVFSLARWKWSQKRLTSSELSALASLGVEAWLSDRDVMVEAGCFSQDNRPNRSRSSGMNDTHGFSLW